jgi:predicted dehydrogenase
MRVLVIGLGSMGKRRIRNLQSIQDIQVAGFDVNSERSSLVNAEYGIPVFENIGEAIDLFGPECFVISTSPESHMEYAFLAAELGFHCFIEASVTDSDRILELANFIETKPLVFAPSCTMRYFPGPKKIKELISTNAIGNILALNYQTGQYLPDWHPWEKIQDFYVSKRDTGGAREIIPFELTWINEIFGVPKLINCTKRKLSSLPADIDDYYHFLMEYPERVIASIQIEVLSRPSATREMRILGSEGSIVFSGDTDSVKLMHVNNQPCEYKFEPGTKALGYINPEEPYILEMNDFILAARSVDQSIFPNNLKADFNILQILNALEELAHE